MDLPLVPLMGGRRKVTAMAKTALTKSSLQEVRCGRCSALLAMAGRSGVSIRRGGVEVLVTGRDAMLQITCYRCGAGRTVSANALVEPSAAPP